MDAVFNETLMKPLGMVAQVAIKLFLGKQAVIAAAISLGIQDPELLLLLFDRYKEVREKWRVVSDQHHGNLVLKQTTLAS